MLSFHYVHIKCLLAMCCVLAVCDRSGNVVAALSGFHAQGWVMYTVIICHMVLAGSVKKFPSF